MNAAITLRSAGPDDARALQRLAQLDSRAFPPAPQLVAERDGRVEAAISLRTRAVVANPFQRTAELCELLRHAAAMQGAAGETPRRQRIGIRPAPVPA
jgi:hypothetical protein